MVRSLSTGEKVKILVNDAKKEEEVAKKLELKRALNSNVLFFRIKSVDVWTRDYLPSFVVNRSSGKLGAIKWQFNAWGNKYEDLLPDNNAGLKAAKQALKQTTGKLFTPKLNLEGGSIEVDGAGTVLTSEQCLLNPNRNPKLNKQKLEKALKDNLGVSCVVWLRNGIEGDDTDGHVDDFCRFAPDNRVLIAQEHLNPSDPNFKTLKENLHILQYSANAKGEPFELVTLPMPMPVAIPERRLPASHANFYIGNKVVLLPVFGNRSDADAIGTIAQVFDNREVIPIPSRELVYGYGGIHCVTQQEPKVYKKPL